MKKISLAFYALLCFSLCWPAMLQAQSSEELVARLAAQEVRADTLMLLNNELKTVNTLMEAVNHTLTVNPDLEAIRFNRDTLHYEVKRAYGAYLPHVDITGGAGFAWKQELQPNLPITGRDFTNRLQGGASISQLLFDGWRSASDIGTNEATYDSVRNRFMDNAEVLSLDSAIAYLEVMRNRSLVDLAVNNVETHQTILASLSERQDLGAGSAADVVQTQARLSRAEATLEETRSTSDISEASFLRSVGAIPGEDMVYPDHPAGLVPPGLDSYILSTLENNPKIKAYVNDIEAAEYAASLARSAFYPTFYLVGSANTDQWDSRNFQTNDFGVMLTMNWNLFSGGSDLNALQAAVSRVRETKSGLRSLEYNLRQEAQATWREYEATIRMVKLMEATVDYNNQTREFYWEQFQLGQRSLLDVLDAENEYFQSSSQLLTWKANEYVAIYRLAALRGAFLPSLGVDPRLYEIDTLSIEGMDKDIAPIQGYRPDSLPVHFNVNMD